MSTIDSEDSIFYICSFSHAEAFAKGVCIRNCYCTTRSGSMSFARESEYCQVLLEGTVRRIHRASIHLLPSRLIRCHLDNLMVPLLHSPLCGTRFSASYLWFHFVIMNFSKCTGSIDAWEWVAAHKAVQTNRFWIYLSSRTAQNLSTWRGNWVQMMIQKQAVMVPSRH